MKTSFNIGISGIYTTVKYITNIENLPTRFKYDIGQFCSNIENANIFISKVREFEMLISDEIIKHNYKYNVCLIILTYYDVIEAISGGYDIRSKIPSLEIAERFVENYNKKYTEAFVFCTETLEYVKNVNDDETYMKDWRRYDKHNDYVRTYMLDIKEIKDTDFKINMTSIHLNVMECLNKLIEINKNK